MALSEVDTGSLASSTQSGEIGACKAVNVSLSGTWVGTAALQRYIGGAWVTVHSWTANVETFVQIGVRQLRARLDFTRTSGTLVYAIEADDGRSAAVAGQLTLETGDLEIGAVEIKDGATDTRAVVTTGNPATADAGLVALSKADAPVAPATATATRSELIGGQYNSAGVTLTDGQQASVQLGVNGGLLVGGPIASGATDTGNPVKVGGRYNSTPPTLTNGQRGDMQVGTRGSLNVTLFASDSTSAVGVSTPSDGSALGNGLTVKAVPMTYNGSTIDIRRSIINGTNSTGTGIAAVGLVAQLDDTSPTAITENQFGNVRMSTDRALLVSQHPYPSDMTPETATSGIISNASAAATLATASARTTYIAGFTATPGAATGAAIVKVVVSGTITGSMTYYVAVTNATTFVPAPTPLVVTFNPPIPASATNTTIVVTMDAVGTGGATAAVNAWGYQL